MQKIRQRQVLERVLLQVLASAPEGMLIHDAYDTVDQHYEFPEEWLRQLPDTQGYKTLETMGYKDWRAIPQEKLVSLVRTEPQWQNEMRWARNSLKNKGLLDGKAPRGTWKLTRAGIRQSGNAPVGLHAAEKRLTTPRKPIRTPVRKRVGSPKRVGKETKPVAHRKEVQNQIANLCHAMPIRDLELVLDMVRAVRKRSLPTDG